MTAPSAEPPRWARALAVAVVVLPIATAVVRAMRADWFPIGDSALLYLRARDVLTSHHPLLGSWTSASQSVGENMNNPGPMYDDLVAPVARLLPFASAAALAVGILNGLTVVAISSVARSIGGWAVQRWMLLASALLIWIMGSELVIDIWQAHALLLPFLLMLLLTTGLALGRWHLLPWAAAIATLLVQTHISYVYVLAVLGLATAAFLAATTRPIAWRRWPRAVLAAPVRWTVAVLALLWVQPLWEQVFGRGKGNLARLAGNASGGDVRLGLGNAIRFAARILVRPPWDLRNGFSWLIPPTGQTPTPDGPVVRLHGVVGLAPAVALLAALLVVIGVLGWSARRRGRMELVAACWIAATTVAATPLCLAGVTVGEVGFAPHHVRWLWTLGTFVTAIVVWGIVDAIPFDRLRSPVNGTVVADAVAGALVVAVAVAAIPYLAQQQGPVADYAAMPVLRKVFPQLSGLASIDPLVYDTAHLRPYEPYSSAVLLRLQQLGVDFRAPDAIMIRQLGDARRARGDEPTKVFQLERLDVFLYAGDACPIARASGLDGTTERAAQAAADDLAARIIAGALPLDAERAPAADLRRVGMALGGDAVEARNLVLDGSLLSWATEGLDVATVRSLRLVDRWVTSTFALYADTSLPCP